LNHNGLWSWDPACYPSVTVSVDGPAWEMYYC